ncbi:MAG: anaerobic ribonucleoside-triphosphate reductase activating protein [Paraclostridium sp.]
MNFSYINDCDLVNGSGARVSLFISGCEHKCPGCFSKKTWDRNYGEKFTAETEGRIRKYLSPPYVDGISILGGDPLATYNREEVYELCVRIKEKYPSKTIYIWTGFSTSYTLNEMDCFVKLADIIVTEKFDEKRSKEATGSINGYYMRGSDNQKFIIKGKVHEELTVDYELDFFN